MKLKNMGIFIRCLLSRFIECYLNKINTQPAFVLIPQFGKRQEFAITVVIISNFLQHAGPKIVSPPCSSMAMLQLQDTTNYDRSNVAGNTCYAIHNLSVRFSVNSSIVTTMGVIKVTPDTASLISACDMLDDLKKTENLIHLFINKQK
ncbi:unnamed protein product [Leptidea sinapis]|uniref:Uncharacterized protein n=1 Tax=Leptidea sinapis TaxID=189913 RepID=A0A5E4QI41_9NEOP|nr:unnamed protein product [Leptidea sinapis]